jgi:hypothetical protein
VRLRQFVGTTTAVCASGQISWGTMVLLLAAFTGGPPRVACVISEPGITDINCLATESASGDPGHLHLVDHGAPAGPSFN